MVAKNYNVLLVDGDVELAENIGLILKSYFSKAVIKIASNFRDAVECLKSDDYSLVISDHLSADED